MILANLSRAIREQNYYAVVLEFLIVIAGVVIGFQITAWNADRDDRLMELSLLDRLHDEVLELIVAREPDTIVMRNRLNKILSVREVLVGSSPFRPLSQDECYALVLAHDFYYPQVTLPSLNEMIASGHFELITNVELRTELSRYVQISEQALAIHEMLIEDSERLTAEHYAYFQNEPRTLTQDEARALVAISRYENIINTERVIPVCLTEAMMDDANFFGDTSDLIGKAHAYDASVISPPDQQLQRLQDMLAIELGDMR